VIADIAVIARHRKTKNDLPLIHTDDTDWESGDLVTGEQKIHHKGHEGARR
jgi:hypothetical protein